MEQKSKGECIPIITIQVHLQTHLCGNYVINPRHACAVRVTVLGLRVCVCVSVTQHLTFHVIICATNDTNLLSGG